MITEKGKNGNQSEKHVHRNCDGNCVRHNVDANSHNALSAQEINGNDGSAPLSTCWNNISDCIMGHSNSSDPRFDTASPSFNMSDALCCSLIQQAANKDRQCFCDVNTYIQQNETQASSIMLLITTCNVTNSLSALDAMCQDISTPVSGLTPSNSSTPSPTQDDATSGLAQSPTSARRNSKVLILAIAVPVVVVLAIAVGIGIYCSKKKQPAVPSDKNGNLPVNETTPQDDIGPVDSLDYRWETLKAATNNFSDDNLIGRGGFGAVYKGTLPDGVEIAVKRLSESSTQGEKEFKNEVAVVAKLQHRNLVTLVGFCLAGDGEKLLVYEFMPNKSLDYLLFRPEMQKELNWPSRYNIIKGVARGMLYLHEDSPTRIMHRDLKAANVLLDAEMNPRIADFGMAKIFDYDQTHCSTTRVVGTHGYMAPEYIINGTFNIKSDVYSFGVLVLEIVSGKRIRAMTYHSGYTENLLSCAWKCWRDGRSLEFMDPTLRDSYSSVEITKCLHLGLLCVQEDMQRRPTMSTIVLMFNSNFALGSLPMTQPPAFMYCEQSSSTNDLNLNS